MMFLKKFRISFVTLLASYLISCTAATNQESKPISDVEYAVANTRIQLHFFQLFQSIFGNAEVDSITSEANQLYEDTLSDHDKEDHTTNDRERHDAFFKSVATHSQCMEQIFPVFFMKYIALTYTESFSTAALFFKYDGKQKEADMCKQISDTLYWFATNKTTEIISKMKTLIIEKWQALETEFEQVIEAQENYQKFVYNRRMLPYESAKLFKSRSNEAEKYNSLIENAKLDMQKYVDKLNSFVNAIKFSPDTEYHSWKSNHWEPHHISFKIWAQAPTIMQMLKPTTNTDNKSRYNSFINRKQTSGIVEVIRSLELNKLIWRKYITKEEILNLAQNIQDKTLLWTSQFETIDSQNKTTYFFREIPLAEMAAMYWSKVDAENKLQAMENEKQSDTMTSVKNKEQSEEVELFNLNSNFPMMMNQNTLFPFETESFTSKNLHSEPNQVTSKPAQLKAENSQTDQEASNSPQQQSPVVDSNNKSFNMSQISPSLMQMNRLYPQEELKQQNKIKQPAAEIVYNKQDLKQNQALKSHPQISNREQTSDLNVAVQQPNIVSGVSDINKIYSSTVNTQPQIKKSHIEQSTDKPDSKPRQDSSENQPLENKTEQKDDYYTSSPYAEKPKAMKFDLKQNQINSIPKTNPSKRTSFGLKEHPKTYRFHTNKENIDVNDMLDILNPDDPATNIRISKTKNVLGSSNIAKSQQRNNVQRQKMSNKYRENFNSNRAFGADAFMTDLIHNLNLLPKGHQYSPSGTPTSSALQGYQYGSRNRNSKPYQEYGASVDDVDDFFTPKWTSFFR